MWVLGLTTGTCLAHVGHRATCLDKDEERVTGLTEGWMLIFYELGLRELVEGGVDQGRLRFSTGLSETVQEAEVIFIAVDTPQAEDGSADLYDVADVAQGIGWALARPEAPRTERPLVVVNESTVPVGSGDYVSMLIREELAEAGEEANFLVASNSECLREGNAICDSLFPDRIVVGSDTREALDTMRAL